jgi:hypothetical protein
VNLKLCPFCQEEVQHNKLCLTVNCPACGATGPWNDFDGSKWNIRTYPKCETCRFYGGWRVDGCQNPLSKVLYAPKDFGCIHHECKTKP